MNSYMELNLLNKASINIDSLNENIKQSSDILIRSENVRDAFKGKYQEIMNNVPDRFKKYVKGVLNKIESSMNKEIAKQRLAIESSRNVLFETYQLFNEINDGKYHVTGELSLAEIDSEIKSIEKDMKNLAFFDVETYAGKDVSYKIINSLNSEVKDIIAESVSDFNQEISSFSTVMNGTNKPIDIQREILELQKNKLESMEKSIVSDIQPGFDSAFESQLFDSFVEYQSGFKSTTEDCVIVESSIDPVEVPSFACDCGGMGRTAFCI